MTERPDLPERREVELGFMFDHSLMSETARQALSGLSAAIALTELLVERGVLDELDVTKRRSSVAAGLRERVERGGLGLFLNEAEDDKYSLGALPNIDCAPRIHLCKAACCTYRFPLARQDVEEGVVQWELGRPYWNRVDASGYCVHNDAAGRDCLVYGQRPAPCRVFDCRADGRIWADFEGMVVSPQLEQRLSELRAEACELPAP